MSAPRIVVVGGGLAGLAAAVEAAEARAHVTLFERRPRLGGATWSFERNGLWFDNGQHVFLRCCTAYRAFLDRIGAAHLVHLQDRLDVPVLAPDGRRGRIRRTGLPAPLHLGSTLARYRFLSPLDRARAGLTALAMRRLDLDDPALDTQTFDAWLRRRGERDTAIGALWDLITLPTVNLPARDASLAMAAKVFQTGLLTDAGAGDIGWSRVPLAQLHGEPAARRLAALGAEVVIGAQVSSVREGPAVALDGGAETLEADAVIVAVPHAAAVDLLPAGAVPQGDRLRQLGQSPIVNVHLIYDRPVLDVPMAAGFSTPVQFIFDRTGPAGLEGPGQCLAISLSAAAAYLGTPSPELTRQMTAAVGDLLPAARAARLVDALVTREPAATFRAVPGTAALRPPLTTRVPGLFLAGAWTDTGWPATMEGAVRSGVAAAQAALTGLGSHTPTPEVVA